MKLRYRGTWVQRMTKMKQKRKKEIRIILLKNIEIEPGFTQIINHCFITII